MPALTQFTIARAVIFTVVVAESGCLSMLGGIQTGKLLGSQWDQFRDIAAARKAREVAARAIEAEARAAVLREEKAEAVSRHKEAAMERAKQIVGQRIRERGLGARWSGKTNGAESGDLGFGGLWGWVVTGPVGTRRRKDPESRHGKAPRVLRLSTAYR